MSKRFVITRQMMRVSKTKVSFCKKVGMLVERNSVIMYNTKHNIVIRKLT